eukprot:912258-Alexandrium_andersonii.AAC.1
MRSAPLFGADAEPGKQYFVRGASAPRRIRRSRFCSRGGVRGVAPGSGSDCYGVPRLAMGLPPRRPL